jgi:hypothetical protein
MLSQGWFCNVLAHCLQRPSALIYSKHCQLVMCGGWTRCEFVHVPASYFECSVDSKWSSYRETGK